MHTTIDLTAPFDPTGMPTVSGAQLLQLVSGLVPHWDKGMIIYTTDNGAGVPDVPDAAVTTIWKRFIWLREGATTVTPYIWNDAAPVHNDGAGNAINKWYSLTSSVGAGTITGAMIANDTILDANIHNLDASKLFGSIVNPVLGNLLVDLIATGTDVKGALTALIIQPDAVTAAKILDNNVINSKVQSVVTTNPSTAATTGLSVPEKIRPSGTALASLRTNSGATASEWFDSWIAKLANPTTAADVGKTVIVDNPYTGGFKLSAVANSYKIYRTPTPVAITNNGLIVDTGHGLGGVPDVVDWKVICTSNTGEYVIGDEVSIHSVQNYHLPPEVVEQAFSGGANATNVFLAMDIEGSIGYQLTDKKVPGAGAVLVFDKTKWSVKVCAIKYI